MLYRTAAQDHATLPPPTPGLLAGASLFLDFDGTLVDLAATPDAVVVDPALAGLLADLSTCLDGRLAIVSGRAIRQIDGFLGAGPFGVSGSHGSEMRWADGRAFTPPPPATLSDAITRMEALAADHPGVMVEHKPYGAGFHYRLAPDAEAACHALAETLAGETGLLLQPGKMMIELRVGGADKGAAVDAFMADPAMRGTTPVFIGDDVTDETAFRAATARGGAGILVGSPRATAAGYHLPDVPATLAWLRTAMEAAA